MRNMGVKGLFGALAGVALLAGCGDGARNDGGRLWSLTAQEDYYSEQAQDEVGRDRSNLGTSSTVFETNEQLRGTGGAGEDEAAFSLAPEPREGGTGGRGVDTQDEVPTRIQGSAQEQENLWLQQDLRTPFPPPPIYIPLGTGKPLRANANGAWVQGTYAVELGANAGQPGGIEPLGGPGEVTPGNVPGGAPPPRPPVGGPEIQRQ